MEFIGKTIAVLPIKEGNAKSTGNPWKVQSYVIESHDEYPKKMCFDVFGEDKINQFNIKTGDELKVSFDVDAHQWQDRWFNSIRAWKVERVEVDAQNQQSPIPNNGAPAPTPQSSDAPFIENNPNDDLPF
jgi:hypothetical protein